MRTIRGRRGTVERRIGRHYREQRRPGEFTESEIHAATIRREARPTARISGTATAVVILFQSGMGVPENSRFRVPGSHAVRPR